MLKKLNLKILALGHLFFHLSDYGFDYVLYPFVIYKLGSFYGGIVMTILSAIVCLGIAYFYDLVEKDLFGIETAKELVEKFFKEEEDIAKKSWIKVGKKMLYFIFHKNKSGQFIFLSIHFDPLITTLYMRPGYHLYNGFSKRDWKIFIGSTIVSNAWWIGVSSIFISIIQSVYHRFF